MDSNLWAAVISIAAGIILTIVARLVDKWLPDPENKHPMPTVRKRRPPPPKEEEKDDAGSS